MSSTYKARYEDIIMDKWISILHDQYNYLIGGLEDGSGTEYRVRTAEIAMAVAKKSYDIRLDISKFVNMEFAYYSIFDIMHDLDFISSVGGIDGDIDSLSKGIFDYSTYNYNGGNEFYYRMVDVAKMLSSCMTEVFMDIYL